LNLQKTMKVLGPSKFPRAEGIPIFSSPYMLPATPKWARPLCARAARAAACGRGGKDGSSALSAKRTICFKVWNEVRVEWLIGLCQ
jgi:hypothetical protein